MSFHGAYTAKTARTLMPKPNNVPQSGLGEDPMQLESGVVDVSEPSHGVATSVSMTARRAAAEAVRKHLAATTGHPLFGGGR